jgi:transcriptional regulator GlxA family with amidase domain
LGIVVPLHCWFRHSFAQKYIYMKTLFYSLLVAVLGIVIAQPLAAHSIKYPLTNKETPQRKDTTKPLKVLFYLQDGVEILDFAGPMEVFTAAGFDVSTVSKTKSPIISQGVLKIIPEYSIGDAPHADIVAVFGGAGVNDLSVIEWIKNKTSPEYYFSVCTGAFILGKAGLLDHLTVTTFRSSIEGLKKAVPKAKVLYNVRYVDNGKVITTAGISAGIDGALHMVAKLKGNAAAAEVAKIMEYDNWVPEKGLVISPKAVSK